MASVRTGAPIAERANGPFTSGSAVQAERASVASETAAMMRFMVELLFVKWVLRSEVVLSRKLNDGKSLLPHWQTVSLPIGVQVTVASEEIAWRWIARSTVFRHCLDESVPGVKP